MNAVNILTQNDIDENGQIKQSFLNTVPIIRYVSILNDMKNK